MPDPLTLNNKSVPELQLDEEEEAIASDEATTMSAIAGSSSLGSAHFDPRAMTPEGLLLYLSTRLGNLDAQMDSIFAREKAARNVRGEINALQQFLNTLPKDTNKEVTFTMTVEQHTKFVNEIDAHLSNIAITDPNLADEIRAHLETDGQILSGDSDKIYNTGEIDDSEDYLGLVSKHLEDGSQMDMINLQSLMGARQTAIQLATNLVSAMSESQKSIVSNIR